MSGAWEICSSLALVGLEGTVLVTGVAIAGGGGMGGGTDDGWGAEATAEVLVVRPGTAMWPELSLGPRGAAQFGLGLRKFFANVGGLAPRKRRLVSLDTVLPSDWSDSVPILVGFVSDMQLPLEDPVDIAFFCSSSPGDTARLDRTLLVAEPNELLLGASCLEVKDPDPFGPRDLARRPPDDSRTTE